MNQEIFYSLEADHGRKSLRQLWAEVTKENPVLLNIAKKLIDMNGLKGNTKAIRATLTGIIVTYLAAKVVQDSAKIAELYE